MSLGSAAAEPSLAHVLPLARGDFGPGLVPQAAAAVFVTAPQTRSALDFSALARTYGLTPAELRMCERLTEGHTLNEAAAHLGISVTTAKTHLARIFSKVGVTRQTDLVALIHRIAPPIRPTRA